MGSSVFVRIRIFRIVRIFRISFRPTYSSVITENPAKTNTDKRSPVADARAVRILKIL